MPIHKSRLMVVLLMAALPVRALAQSVVSPTHKYTWGENIGWINFRDAGQPAGGQGVMLDPTILSGYAWGENIGWMNLGDGSPANGTSYANTTGSDSGVNLDPATKRLTGLAWGENIGWINFSAGALAAPPQPARLDGTRLRGYAWGENIGWINFEDEDHFISFRCAGDFNDDGILDFFDVLGFLNAFAIQDPAADYAPDGLFDIFDVLAFLNAFSTGCGA